MINWNQAANEAWLEKETKALREKVQTLEERNSSLKTENEWYRKHNQTLVKHILELTNIGAFGVKTGEQPTTTSQTV